MRKSVLIISTLICLSCSYNYNRDIKRIEKILEIELKGYDYKITNAEHSFGFGEELVIFYIEFNKQSFDSFLEEVDVKKFSSIPLGIYEYSLTVERSGYITSLLIDLDSNILKYTYKE